jgi:hypothetical protein
MFNFKDEEIEAMRRWFVEHHYPQTLDRPHVAEVQPAASLQPASPPPLPPVHVAPAALSTSSSVARLGICQKCGIQCNILWGKFGYYWKCPACQNNMPIKEYCPKCRGKLKLRKDKLRFYKYCEPCKTPEVLFYEG